MRKGKISLKQSFKKLLIFSSKNHDSKLHAYNKHQNICNLVLNKKLILIFFLFSSLFVNGQRLNFGFGMNFMNLYSTHFKDDVVFAKHSYKAYYVKQNQFSFSGSYQMSFIANIDYGRYIFTTEFGYFFQNDGIRTKLSYPMAYDGFFNYYSKISYNGYSINPIVSYVLTNRRTLKLFAEIGLPYMILNKGLLKEKIAYGPKSTDSYLPNQNEMISEFGLNHDYFNVMLGIGYRLASGSFSLRYINKINSKHDTGSNIGYFTVNLSVFTNFSKLKKHYIYIE